MLCSQDLLSSFRYVKLCNNLKVRLEGGVKRMIFVPFISAVSSLYVCVTS